MALTLNEYQTKALETAVFSKGTGGLNDLYYLLLGLGGEVGEVQNKVKKLIRDHDLEDLRSMTPQKRQDLAFELGDCFWYLVVILWSIGYPLEEAARMNLEKLAVRKAEGTLKGEGDKR